MSIPKTWDSETVIICFLKFECCSIGDAMTGLWSKCSSSIIIFDRHSFYGRVFKTFFYVALFFAVFIASFFCIFFRLL